MKIYHSLSPKHAEDVLCSSITIEASPVALAGICDTDEKTLTLFLLTKEVIVIPLSVFMKDVAKPDFEKFSLGDHGHSICFGRGYEAGTDTVVIDARLNEFKQSLKTNWEKKFEIQLVEKPRKK